MQIAHVSSPSSSSLLLLLLLPSPLSPLIVASPRWSLLPRAAVADGKVVVASALPSCKGRTLDASSLRGITPVWLGYFSKWYLLPACTSATSVARDHSPLKRTSTCCEIPPLLLLPPPPPPLDPFFFPFRPQVCATCFPSQALQLEAWSSNHVRDD